MFFTAQDWCKFARPEWVMLSVMFLVFQKRATHASGCQRQKLHHFSHLPYLPLPCPNGKKNKLRQQCQIISSNSPSQKDRHHQLGHSHTEAFPYTHSRQPTSKAVRKTTAVKALLKPLCLSTSGFLSFSLVFSYKAKNTSAVKAINNGDNCVAGLGVKLTV